MWKNAKTDPPKNSGYYSCKDAREIEFKCFYSTTLGCGRTWVVPNGIEVTHWKVITQK